MTRWKLNIEFKQAPDIKCTRRRLAKNHPKREKIASKIREQVKPQNGEAFRDLIKNLPYSNLAAPLIEQDRSKGMSLNQIAIKYGLTIKQIRVVLGC